MRTATCCRFPFNASTPILYYNKDQFRLAGIDADNPPLTWPDVETAARKLRERNIPCGVTTGWPAWINIENFSAFHNLPLASLDNGMSGLHTELQFNNMVVTGHLGDTWPNGRRPSCSIIRAAPAMPNAASTTANAAS